MDQAPWSRQGSECLGENPCLGEMLTQGVRDFPLFTQPPRERRSKGDPVPPPDRSDPGCFSEGGAAARASEPVPAPRRPFPFALSALRFSRRPGGRGRDFSLIFFSDFIERLPSAGYRSLSFSRHPLDLGHLSTRCPVPTRREPGAKSPKSARGPGVTRSPEAGQPHRGRAERGLN